MHKRQKTRKGIASLSMEVCVLTGRPLLGTTGMSAWSYT